MLLQFSLHGFSAYSTPILCDEKTWCEYGALGCTCLVLLTPVKLDYVVIPIPVKLVIFVENFYSWHNPAYPGYTSRPQW